MAGACVQMEGPVSPLTSAAVQGGTILPIVNVSLFYTWRYLLVESLIRIMYWLDLFIWGFTSLSTLYRSYHNG